MVDVQIDNNDLTSVGLSGRITYSVGKGTNPKSGISFSVTKYNYPFAVK